MLELEIKQIAELIYKHDININCMPANHGRGDWGHEQNLLNRGKWGHSGKKALLGVKIFRAPPSSRASYGHELGNEIMIDI